jgi:GNAT superfamily N-acetyltransferase
MTAVYEVLSGEQARSLVGQLQDLYAEVYAEPPYLEGPEMVERFAQRLADQWDVPGFSLVSAMEGGCLLGAAYGWTMAAGRWFRSATTEPPAELREASKFAVMEWMVRPDRRRRGIGRVLLDRLLAGRPEPWAVLASNPAAAARRIYERWGWKPVGGTKPDSMPPMDLLALPLRPREP